MSDRENDIDPYTIIFDEYNSDEDHSEYKDKTIITQPLYPLRDKWILYDHTKSDSNTYESSTRKVCEIDSIVKFWKVFNNYHIPSIIFNNGINRPYIDNREISSLSFFKEGISPKWEDPSNKFGGEFSKRKFTKKHQLEELDSNWMDLLIACISSSVFDSSITGIRVVDSSSPRKNESTKLVEFKLLYRIEIWFSDNSKKDEIECIFKNILDMPKEDQVFFKEHMLNKN